MKLFKILNLKLRPVLIAILLILCPACFIVACQSGGPEEVSDKYEIVLSKSKLTLVQYNEYVLTATVLKNGEPLQESVSWATSDNNIVSVSNGTLTAINEGSAVISAVYDQYVAKCNVTVERYFEPELRLSLSHNEVNLLLDDNKSEEVTLTPTLTLNEEVQTEFSVTYESENQSIATVSNKGVVTAVAAGKTTIKATATLGEYEAYCYCTVTVEVPKTSVLDHGEYIYEIATGGEFDGIPFSYGAVTNVFSESGAIIEYSEVGGKVYIDYPGTCPKGVETIRVESATHVVYAEVYIADRFISDVSELELAVSEMADDKLFVLDSDINMSDYVWNNNSGTKSLFTFKGEFDGKGYKLYGIENTDGTRFTKTFTFAPNSHIHDVCFEVKELVLNQSEDKADYVFGGIQSDAVIENCVFDLNVDVYSWMSAMFETVSGKLLNSAVIFRNENPNTLTSGWLSGEVNNVVYVYSSASQDVYKFMIGSSNGANYSSMTGIINNLYLYPTVADAYNGTNGKCFYGNGVVRYGGNEYSASDWWANSVDVTGDGVNDDTWGYSVVETASRTANEVLAGSNVSIDGAGYVAINDRVIHTYTASDYTNKLTLFVDDVKNIQLPTIKIDGVETSDYTVEFKSDNPSVLKISDGVCTAIEGGNAKVTARITFTGDSYASLTLTYSVTVIGVDETDKTIYDYSISDEADRDVIAFDEQEYGRVTQLVEIESGDNYIFTTADGGITLLPDINLRGEYKFVVASNTYSKLVTVYIADGFVSTADEFLAMESKMTDNTLFALKGDVDLSTASWDSGYLFGTIKGEFDGRGYKLMNIVNPTGKEGAKIIKEFATGSEFHDVYFVTGETGYTFVDGFSHWESPFGDIRLNATVRDCVFDLKLNNADYGNGLFVAIAGNFENSIIIYRTNSICVTSLRLSGTAKDIVVIGGSNFGNISKVSIGSSNHSDFSLMSGKLEGIYFYSDIANAISGTGKALDENKDGKIVYNGRDFAIADWWANNVDVTGDGANDDTSSLSPTEATNTTVASVINNAEIVEGRLYWNGFALA